jgi:hypothetical protein
LASLMSAAPSASVLLIAFGKASRGASWRSMRRPRRAPVRPACQQPFKMGLAHRKGVFGV